MSSEPLLYLPVFEPSLIIEGCETLLKGVLERLIEKQINGISEYTSEQDIIRVKVSRIELIFDNVQ